MGELFDDISRIVASPMPRRQTLRLIAGAVVAGAALPTLWSRRGWAAEMTIAEILEKLARARSRAKAEIAIRHLLNKAGVGIPRKGSRYENYLVSDDQIPELAQQHVNFLNGSQGLAVGRLYHMLVATFEPINAEITEFSLHPTDLNTSLSYLRQEASTALGDPESPDHAFLIAIIAQGASIPTSVPLYDATTTLSPVQAFLFNLWLTNESLRYLTPLDESQGITACQGLCFTAAFVAGQQCALIVFLPAALACAAAVGAGLAFCLIECRPTLITLVSFTAKAHANGTVTLVWETATEVDNAGFNLYRARARGGPYIKINNALIPAEGDSVSGASYSFVDTPGYGTFSYVLEDVDYYGEETRHRPIKARVRQRQFPHRRRR